MHQDPVNRDVIRSIEWDCHRLLHRIYIAGDFGDFDRFGEIFADDGEWVRGGRTDRGPGAMIARSRSNPPRIVQHILGNISIDVEPGLNRATGTAYYIAYLRAGSSPSEAPVPLEKPHSTGVVDAVFSNGPSGWRISNLSSRAIFISQS